MKLLLPKFFVKDLLDNSDAFENIWGILESSFFFRSSKFHPFFGPRNFLQVEENSQKKQVNVGFVDQEISPPCKEETDEHICGWD